MVFMVVLASKSCDDKFYKCFEIDKLIITYHRQLGKAEGRGRRNPSWLHGIPNC